jgi:hypothetical protein
MEVVTASIAGIRLSRAYLVVLGDLVAVLADNTFRVVVGYEPRQASVIVGKILSKLGNAVSHGVSISVCLHTVKG